MLDEVIFEFHTIPVVERVTVISNSLGTEMHLEAMWRLTVLEKDGLLRFNVFAGSIDESLHLLSFDINQAYWLISSAHYKWERVLIERQRYDKILLIVWLFWVSDLFILVPVFDEYD